MASSAVKRTTEESWKAFFKEADLEDVQAANYAKIMVTNRVTRSEDIDKEVLQELGITTIGDILNIMRIIKKGKKQDGPQVNTKNFKPKLEPPRIKEEMTKAEFL